MADRSVVDVAKGTLVASVSQVAASRLDQLCAEVARINRQARHHLRNGRDLEAWSALVSLFAVYQIIRESVEDRLANPLTLAEHGGESSCGPDSVEPSASSCSIGFPGYL